MATYETEISGIRILPGAWRPHYEWEQIAWISPPWPSQDYIWYDFPEAIFSNMGLLYLSHVNPSIQSAFAGLPGKPGRTTLPLASAVRVPALAHCPVLGSNQRTAYFP